MPVADVLYPVDLVVEGRRCVVVGGGAVAARKVEGLVAAGAEVVVIAPEIDDHIRSLAVEVMERPYRPGDLEDAWLVIAATDDGEVNRAIRADADRARVWINAVDDPSACSFTLPAVVRRGPVMVTVSTAGHSPALASWVRGELAAQLGPEVGLLAELLSEARDQLKAAGRSTEEVDWRPALDWDMLELIRSGRTAQARERLQACLSSS
jgi:precorrin-2 dehydrogenase/sirohydrochlorin ferrochelatase